MASLSTDKKNGHRTIQFMGGDGKRYSIRLGKVPKKMAEGVRLRVEYLANAKMMGQPLDQGTSQWLINIEDVLYSRLAACGLVEPRSSHTFHGWIEDYLERRKPELKSTSYKKLSQTADKLKHYFKPHVVLTDLKLSDGQDWRLWMFEQGLSEASVKTHCGNAKTILLAAVDHELINRSPFAKLPSGNTPTKNTRYVTPDEAKCVIDACSGIQWKMLFGLARFAGLRTPSETHLMMWDMIDWQQSRMLVRSPKTEHHKGHESRIVPITPNLMALLREGAEQATSMNIITIKDKHNLRRGMIPIIQASGVELWEDLFQTLRRSCEIEWAQDYPQYAVSKWIGHSIEVSGRHYANSIPDELYSRITGQNQIGSNDKVVHNPVQHAAASDRTVNHR